MNYVDIIRHICQALNENAVDYMIVGGTAVALHGYDRPSTNPNGDIVAVPDVDVWYNPNYENYYRLLNAIEQLGKDVSAYRDEEQPDPKNAFFKLAFDDYTLDFLPKIKAPLRFRSSFRKREIFQSDGVDISFISLAELIQDKSVNPRPKDIDDIQHLRKE